jgi:N-acetylmuramic acid 6-phosphate etherase
MEKKNTGILRSAMIGMAVGTALTAAGAMYIRENRTAQRAMDKAKELGCVTVGISCNPDTKILKCTDIPIFTDTGAEVLTGSTRLKAGTAQKIVLNTLTTCAMAKTGKVYENMMINLAPSNEKLKNRVIRIVKTILCCEEDEAVKALEENGWNIRKAVEAKKGDKTDA